MHSPADIATMSSIIFPCARSEIPICRLTGQSKQTLVTRFSMLWIVGNSVGGKSAHFGRVWKKGLSRSWGSGAPVPPRKHLRAFECGLWDSGRQEDAYRGISVLCIYSPFSTWCCFVFLWVVASQIFRDLRVVCHPDSRFFHWNVPMRLPASDSALEQTWPFDETLEYEFVEFNIQ